MDGDIIGEFVPLGTAGTLEDKETVQIRIGEIHNAIRLPLAPLLLNGDATAIRSVVSNSIVRRQIWGNQKAAVTLREADYEKVKSGSAKTSVYSLGFGKLTRSTKPHTALMVCRSKSVVTKARISRIANQYDCDNVVVLISATSKHFVAISYENCKSQIIESSRSAFELTGVSA